MKTKLTNSQNEQLIRLNRRLAEIEHGIRQRVESMRPAFDSDLACVIEFRIREDDPGWDAENDNIIAPLVGFRRNTHLLNS